MGFITDKINECKYKDDLATAVKMQNQVAFYTEINNNNPFNKDFLSRVSTIYNHNSYKVQRFSEAFRGDVLASIELLDTCWGDLSRVFDPQNKVVSNKLTTEEKITDANNYLSKYDDFWRQDTWKALQTNFNSLVVVDLPTFQSRSLPEPYPFLLDIGNVQYISFTGRSPKEIIFIEKRSVLVDGEKKETLIYFYYTEDFYSSYDENENLIGEIIPHNLGYCPAQFFWKWRLNSQSNVIRQNPVTPNVEGLFWYSYKTIESRKADLLYLNPDKQKPSSSCGYEAPNKKCFGGKLVNINKQPIINSSGTQELCPNCGTEQHNSGGAGNVTSIDLSVPAIQNGVVNPAAPLVSYTSPPIEGVQEQYKRITDLKTELQKAISGVDVIMTKEAINENQVETGYQSRENILMNIADAISFIRQWTNKTMLKLRYDKAYIDNSYFQGSKFFTRTVNELQLSKIASTDPIEKGEIQTQILNVKYKGNPEKMKREELLYKFLPMSNLTDTEFIELYKVGKIAEEDFILRTDFNNIIARFESQKGDIAQFFDTFFSETVDNFKRYKIIKEYLNELIIIKTKKDV